MNQFKTCGHTTPAKVKALLQQLAQIIPQDATITGGVETTPYEAHFQFAIDGVVMTIYVQNIDTKGGEA